MRTAVVVDGAFFLRRFKHRYPELDPHNPRDVSVGLMFLAAAHISISDGGWSPAGLISTVDDQKFLDTKWTESDLLYRIFFYDCQPLTKRTHLPISKRALNLAGTDVAKSRLAIHEALLNVRKVALRLGRLNDQFGWRVKPLSVERWLADSSSFAPTDDDFELDTVQKGVDMRLGLDVASMAFKRQVSQIVLVAADADFVPAVKLARREGIDVVLDPMGAPAASDLVANCDGVRNAVSPPRNPR
ncbi:NYN domain-containing protein [Sphingomonas sp. SUN039]|uniref:NYN domain-containing protein n=1 Tax=Sphingomonas sp. SUN039 TaxID=2937787 RepID=UPI002164CB9E|nr:NYN domain-containing protein [Sphingomonas sp. SUN039]UVO54972.1 NYN domain-containing protein [Sphingomonas sp. SUN039]